jgi:hypothetical protein
MKTHSARVITLAALAIALVLPFAAASEPFIFSGEPVHPGCVHALVMQPGDVVPVMTSLSLPGCAASERSKARLQFDKEIIYIQDEKLTGDGSFGYRHLSTLDNGLFLLGLRRVDADGTTHISLAAMAINKRPVLQKGGQVGERLVLEMVGEVRLPDMRMASLKVVGNRVQFSAGAGTTKVDGSVDLSRIGRALR